MSQFDKILMKIVLGKSDNNIKFSELKNFLLYLGFEMRINSSHHIFRNDAIPTKLNLQKDGDMAKAYQVKQVRKLIIDFKLGENIDV